MLNFENDYSTGAHPEILRRLAETNLEPLSGYGNDKYSQSARKKILTACGCPDGDVYFISGGTQTNAIAISAMLQSYEGVISTETGHINSHEAGAVELTGHKVLALPHHGGKISPDELRGFLSDFYNDKNHEHMVFPGMVYISHPTEYGTLYTKAELGEISGLCRQYSIPLFVDGARLGCGLAAGEVKLPDLARLCDVFYIGGTKSGALCGEAVVFPNGAPPRFMTVLKQRGALMAKGRLMGVQFDALFTDNLYFKLGRRAVELAERLKTVLSDSGYEFAWESPTNQQFIIMDNEDVERLEKDVVFSFWEKLDENRTVVRFVTSWSTDPEDIERLRELL